MAKNKLDFDPSKRKYKDRDISQVLNVRNYLLEKLKEVDHELSERGLDNNGIKIK